jgi:4-hydroxy-tetrahydrodipicolinate synthase
MSREDCILSGVIPAMVTPATDDASDIDTERAKALTTRLIETGVHGLFAGASTGEAPLLTRDQRMRLIDAISESNSQAKLPLLAGVGAMSTLQAIQYAKDAEAHGAGYVVALPLHFIKVSEEELYGYFAAIADSVSVPTLLYNYPALTSGQNITPKLAARLAASHNVVGIKDSSGDFSQATLFMDACGPGFAVFTGLETLLLPLLSHGGSGTICAAANVVPRRIVELYDSFCIGEIEDALDMQRRLGRASHLWKIGTFPTAVKAACTLVGESVGPPFAPVSAANAEQIDELKVGLAKYFDIDLRREP